ncbi:hypothetical protein VTK56DRAFT_5647 [Thermocarpiscus australiensis]
MLGFDTKPGLAWQLGLRSKWLRLENKWRYNVEVGVVLGTWTGYIGVFGGLWVFVAAFHGVNLTSATLCTYEGATGWNSGCRLVTSALRESILLHCVMEDRCVSLTRASACAYYPSSRAWARVCGVMDHQAGAGSIVEKVEFSSLSLMSLMLDIETLRT